MEKIPCMRKFKFGGIPGVREKLLEHREALIESIRKESFEKAVDMINTSHSKFLMRKRDYDHYNITPYNMDVTEKCGLAKYVNASFIKTATKCYFASQMPKPEYFNLFKEFIHNSGADLVVSLLDHADGDYFDETELIKRIKVPFGKPEASSKTFFYDEVYNMGTYIRRLRYFTWTDHKAPDPEEFKVFYSYFKNIAAKSVIVHCHAGVGRTGTFIMYDILKEEECVTLESFTDTFLYLRACRPFLVFRAEQLRFLRDQFLPPEKA